MSSDTSPCLANNPLSWAIHNGSNGPLSPSDPILIICCAGKCAGEIPTRTMISDSSKNRFRRPEHICDTVDSIFEPFFLSLQSYAPAQTLH